MRAFVTFHLDVGVGDAVVAPPEWLTGQDWLAFAGISPARIAALAREQQFAEKIHAYTLPRRDRTNTRVKDLVDLLLLITLGLPNAEQMRQALHATFARRHTHAVPDGLEPPPERWSTAYTALAAECGLAETTIDQAFDTVSGYWEALDIQQGR